MNTDLILASRPDLPVFTLGEAARKQKLEALEASALIGKVQDLDSKTLAVRAQVELKRCSSQIESARKKLKEPLLQAGRQLDNLCAAESLDLDKEIGRISALVTEFDLIERRRVVEEERLQREELAKIEREKQMELRRIADEQAAREAEALRLSQEAERKVREEREAAERLVREAKNKADREAAKLATIEAEKRQAEALAEKAKRGAILAEQAREANKQAQAVDEKAGDAAYCAARPIEITKVAGQRMATTWKITVDQPFVLAKFHPDLVNITPRLAEIKERLNDGQEVRGITAVRELTSGVRLPPERKAIEV